MRRKPSPKSRRGEFSAARLGHGSEFFLPFVIAARESSSILKTVFRFGSLAVLLLVSCPVAVRAIAGQESEDSGLAAKKPDAFYSGSVVESTETTLVVSRTVLGKKERRNFAITADSSAFS